MNSTKPRGTARIANRRMWNVSISGIEGRDATARQRLSLPGARCILPLLLLLILPTLAEAQFNYTVENRAVTIMRYTGSGGDVLIPGTIDGMPVTGIGYAVFRDYTNLTSVTIPVSVTSIWQGAFWGCTSLTAITVDVLNPAYSSLDGVLFDRDQTTLIQCPGGRAGSYAIPDSVTRILPGAFSDCTGLTSVTIPNSVTSIEGSSAAYCGAFSRCSGLTSVTIGNSVTSIGYYAFSDCTGLISITIPDSVTSIGGRAFSGCTGLTSVTIGHNVTSIGGSAFSGCNGLTTITIPDSVTSIGRYAFSGCTGLTSITIPDSVISIGEEAFSGCTGLTTVTIGNGVTDINRSAFSGCAGLTAITVDPLNPAYSDLEAVLFNKTQTELIQFPASKSGIYTVPDSVTSIGGRAFSGCTGLTSVTIPESVTRIWGSAFSGCTSLTTVTIPTSVTSIEYGIFSGCTGLTSVTIPTSVTLIRDWAFSGCTGEIGKVYSIEYVTDLTDPAESDWRCLEYLQLPASPYLWADKSAPATGKRFYRAVAMEAPTNMVFIPPGTFRMGSPTNEVDRYDWEGPQTDVIISRGFGWGSMR
jgi:hypothetical protein